MTSRTFASSPGGGGSGAFSRIIPLFVNGTSVTGVTGNRSYCSYIEVPFDCTVASLGFPAGAVVDGNMYLGLYDSSFNQLCVTNEFAVAGLAANSYNWVVPTTLPALTRGRYWIAFACDTTYAAGVAGVQYRLMGSTTYANIIDSTNLGNFILVRHDVYPLPAIFVPVNQSNGTPAAMVMRVTM